MTASETRRVYNGLVRLVVELTHSGQMLHLMDKIADRIRTCTPGDLDATRSYTHVKRLPVGRKLHTRLRNLDKSTNEDAFRPRQIYAPGQVDYSAVQLCLYTTIEEEF
ncbi:unnamed protein product, partial [Dicrocoelium dendriticum]